MTGSRAPLLYPLVAEAARRVGANAVGLVDVGCAAGLSLALDRVRIAYDTGQVLGDPTSPVEATARFKGRTLLLDALPPQPREAPALPPALDAAARPLAWVSAEGVGVAPAVPTFGDRPASGHSILGLALFDHSTLHVEAMGRCWSQGRILSWLGSTPGSNPA